jgi:hypothetical protein
MTAPARLILWTALVLTTGLELGCTPGPVDVATLSSGGLTSGLVGHWTFDEGSGMVANDSSGNGRGGLISGPGWSWTDGRFGGALHFSGVDQVTVLGLPQATESYSVSAWLLVASSELGSPVANILNTEQGLGGGWALYATLVQGYGSYDFRYWIGLPQQYEMDNCNCVVPDAWVHLAAVVDATDSSLTLYVNGVAKDVLTTTGAISPGSPTLYLGRGQMPGVYALTGALDDVAIYDRALVPQEIAELDQAPAPDPQ